MDCWIKWMTATSVELPLASSFAKGAAEDWPTLSALEGERKVEGRAGVTGEVLALVSFITIAAAHFRRLISASCRASRACSAMSVAVGMGGRAGGREGLARLEWGG